jgi:hypothetical protein
MAMEKVHKIDEGALKGNAERVFDLRTEIKGNLDSKITRLDTKIKAMLKPKEKDRAKVCGRKERERERGAGRERDIERAGAIDKGGREIKGKGKKEGYSRKEIERNRQSHIWREKQQP